MPRWTPESRAKQRLLIQNWQPWRQSTGPLTASGKASSSRNADKGGQREYLRRISRLLREAANFAGHTGRH
jgi:hypothetical protein